MGTFFDPILLGQLNPIIGEIIMALAANDDREFGNLIGSDKVEGTAVFGWQEDWFHYASNDRQD
jgi:hypothetical protein